MSPQSWPATATETVRWHDGQPYEACIPALIAMADGAPSRPTAALADEATRAVTRFDERFGSSDVAAVMLHVEAMASSRLEGIHTNARSLGEAELGVGSDPAALLVAQNVRAMEILLGSSLGAAGLLQAHGALLEGVPGAGAWRQEQVWIGFGGRSPIDAHLVPPVHDRVPELMDDLMTYASRIDLPPLAQAAITHAQFETIHPFTDGNGRIGRALVHAILKDADVAGSIVAPVSFGLLANRREYYRSLDAYREGDVDPIVELFADAAFRAASTGARLAEEISRVSAAWRDRVAARADSAVWPMLELLTARPVVNPAVLEAELGLGYMRTKRAMDALVQVGIVEAVGKHQQGRFWCTPEMLTPLDAYVARASRQWMG